MITEIKDRLQRLMGNRCNLFQIAAINLNKI